ncbi:MAG TPA: amino acid adenylation domain-containing protein [Roseiflexaceae bacterium]|nr:amino acid adenylation domain-containing protein [Roseiflexaceae bacterium]
MSDRFSLKNLSPEQLAAFDRFLEDEGAGTPPAPGIPRQAERADRPLSFAQERLWFLHQYLPESAVYHIPLALRLRGPLRVEAIGRALELLVARHEVLRTTFADRAGQPVQVIHPPGSVALPLVDLAGLPATQREQAAQTHLQAELLRPFDLHAGPLLRAALLRLDEHEHVLGLVIHHLVFDGWSVGVLARELGACYAAACADRAPDLPALPVQYLDYALWQREQSGDAALAGQIDYWRERLADAPVRLDLPADRPRPAVQRYSGALLPVRMSAAAVADLRRICQDEGATLFMGLLAVFQNLLARYSAQTDLVVGTPIAGRTRSELEGLIGCFVNMLALRADLSANPSFRALLRQVRAATLDAYAHQDVQFEQVVEALLVERNTAYPPVFQTVFAFQNTPGAAPALPGLQVSPFPFKSSLAKFELQLDLWETADGGLEGEWLYNTDLFDRATVERMAEHMVHLLAELSAHPDRPVFAAALPISPVVRPAAPFASADPARPLHALFEEQAARRPEALALCCGDQRLSYGELNQRANAVAHHLRGLGVGPEALVGLYAERSIELVVGLLGILKAGAAYLPIDPAYPADRIAFMLDDAGARVLLTQTALRADLAGSTAALVCLDALEQPDAALPNPDSGAAADNLAYVIYTSGSTGRPKGVQITHRHVARLLDATQHWFDFGPDDTWTLFHSTAFDFSVWEIWGALAYGGRLVVVPYLVSRSPALFAELLSAEAVTVLNQTPSSFRQVMAALLEADLPVPALRYVIFGGEALSFPALRPWFERHGDQRPLLVNMYGITETTVHVTYRPVRAADLQGAAASLIGEPIPDLELYVLDRYGQPAPIGTPGELYVGGAGVARGYLHRPELTAERFVPNPFGAGGWGLGAGEDQERRTVNQEPSADDAELKTQNSKLKTQHPPSPRIYKTGDVVRRLPSGDLEYLGRSDAQVKIRGFRIELGEIEALLARHPAVAECAVLLREDAPGDKRLVAYLVPVQQPEQESTKDTKGTNGSGQGKPVAQGQDLGGKELKAQNAELRSFLQESLPDYMVPSAFVALEALPLTPSGKLDRRALPAPSQERPELGHDYLAPRTSEEALLARVWGEVLGLERVGVHDTFFALGGDSMRSVQVLAAARARGVDFTLQQLFQHQTVAALAPHVRVGERAGEAPLRATPFCMVGEADRQRLPEGVEDAYPLTMLQAGMIYHMTLIPDAPEYHNVDSYHYRGAFDIVAFRRAVGHVVARHPVLRTGFDLTGYGEPLQLVYAHAPVEVEEEDLRDLDAGEQARVIGAYVERERLRLFDLARPPLLRFRIHRRSDSTFQFTLTECHAILDGWSLSTVLSEIFACHAALLAEGRLPALPEQRSSFSDFVLQERRALESEEHRAFWREQLRGASMLQLPRWPANHRAPAHTAPVMDSRAVAPELLARLRAVAQAEAVPLKSVLLAAHFGVLRALTGERDLLSGMAFHGRLETVGGEHACGLFLNPQPLRMRLDGGSWRDLIQACFAAECGQLPFRTYPQATIQQEWGGERLFEVLFNYTHFRQMADVVHAGQLELLDVHFASEPTNLPLLISFYVDPMSDDLRLFVQYQPAALCAEQVAAIIASYQAALTTLADAPAARYDTADLLSPDEHAALHRWSYDATAATPPEALIHELFEAQVARRPDAVALVVGDQTLSYAELDRRADALAARLRARGVGADTLVALHLERSPELIVCLLAVLKAGGAYLPLEPVYPAARLALLLRDARPALLLTQPQLREAADELLREAGDAAPEMLVLEEALFRTTAAPAPSARGLPDRLAYVSYTSGSTGAPKGVAVPHRGVARLVWRPNYITLDAEATLLQFAPVSFDASTFEIWGALLNGARLVIAPPHAPTLDELAALIERSGVTVLWATTGLFHLFAEAHVERLRGLRALLTGGESVSPVLALRARTALPDTRLVSMYGPTENTTFSTFFPVDALDPADPLTPIGRPINQTSVYVLDEQLNPVPVGTPGELYVGGEGLARGYLHRPDLTAERFVPNPFGGRLETRGLRLVDPEVPEATRLMPHASDEELQDSSLKPQASRLYKTGDIVRFRPDGVLEFLGRRDQQVKIRGFRIELGEIEAVLTRHPDVREAVVLVREDAPGNKRLVAYLVPEEPDGEARGLRLEAWELNTQNSELKTYLKGQLPDYMVPGALVWMERLPLLPNGKVDRRALPDVQTEAAPADDRAPVTPTEVALAEIWAGVLGQPAPGVGADFFALGGHSLALMRLALRLRERFAIELALHELFDATTLAQMAALIDSRAQASPAPATAIPTVYSDEQDQDLDGLSDDDIDALLREALSEE